ncbi:MAG: hypothetical protein JWP22_1638 [Ramlibacter sp.]|nr:hypothetical protein [Ramlibacter sp.]MDB5912963.1 hypothetical protein [Ramlibacter sp.]
MSRSSRWIAAAALALVLLAVCVYYRLWGGVALLAVAAAGSAWYRIQVSRGEATEQFFGDFGEETRLTAFQGGSPSEMPVDRSERQQAQPHQPPAGS